MLFSGSYDVLGSNLFETEIEVRDLIHKENTVLENNYKKQINNVNDLLNFMLNNNVCYCEEYSDAIARDVAVEKMKQFGFEVNERCI